MRLALPALALLVCLPLAGCTQAGTKNTDSTKDFTGEQKAVAATIEHLQTAAKDKDGAKICGELITADLRDRISATDCQQVMKDAIRDTDEVDLIVKTVKITKNAAVATLQEKTGDKAHRDRTVQLQKVAGAWRISALPQAQAS